MIIESQDCSGSIPAVRRGWCASVYAQEQTRERCALRRRCVCRSAPKRTCCGASPSPRGRGNATCRSFYGMLLEPKTHTPPPHTHSHVCLCERIDRGERQLRLIAKSHLEVMQCTPPRLVAAGTRNLTYGSYTNFAKRSITMGLVRCRDKWNLQSRLRIQ